MNHNPVPFEPADFDLALPDRVLFGSRRAAQIPTLAAELGSRAFVCTGSRPQRHDRLLSALRSSGLAVRTLPVDGEPTIATAASAAADARSFRADLVLAVGGGSVLDLGKAVAMLLANGGDPLDYIEVIGRGKPITARSVPLVLVPTTAGSGSEVTSNAVLGSPSDRVKVSLRSRLMLAHLTVVDPELTLGAPAGTTASAGVDALTQCLEPYVSPMSSPVTDGFAVQGLAHAARSLRRVFDDGSDLQARADMAVCSLLGGLSLSNAKLGAVHGIAGPFGGMYDSPHGAVCAALLAPVMRVNLRALREREPGSRALGRYEEVARILTGNGQAGAEDGEAWVRETVGHLGVEGLATYGMTAADTADLVDRARRSSSMKGNPIVLTPQEIRDVLEMSA